MDLTDWLEYFTEGLSTQLHEVTERGKRAMRADLIVKQYALNGRQAKAIGHVLEHGRLRIQDYEALCSETNRRTLQRDLNFLLENGLLLEQGSGPTDPTRAYLPGEALA